jgi:stage II sporulation protein E
MEKTEITLERPIYGKALPPSQSYEKKVKTSLLVDHWGRNFFVYFLGFLWGNTTVFGLLNPLGIAYLSAFLLRGNTFYPVAAAVSVGLIWGGFSHGAKYIGAVIFCLVIHVGIGSKLKEAKTWQKGLLGGAAIFLAGVLFSVWNGGSIFYLCIAGIEGVSVFLLTYITERGILFLQDKTQRRRITTEEFISIAIVLGGAIAGAAEITVPILNIPFMLIPAATLITLAGWRGGVGMGSACGVLLGFSLLLCGKGDLGLFCAFGLGGLFSGGLKELGRIASGFGFLGAVLLLLFYQNHAMLELNFIKGLVLGLLLFLLIPKKALVFLNAYDIGTILPEEDQHFLKMKEMTEKRIHDFAEAFYGLGRAFQQGNSQVKPDKKNITNLIDTIGDKACKNCGMTAYCWDTECYRTYQMTFSALSLCERRGKVSLHQMPEDFQENCVRKEFFIDTINRTYEKFRLERTWESKLRECRGLVSQQLFAVGQIMEDFTKELDVRNIYLEGKEQEIAARLEQEGLRVKEIRVAQGRQYPQGQEVTIVWKGCNGNANCKKVISIVSKVLGKPMQKAGGKNVCYGKKNHTCELLLVEENRYRLTVATASRPKEDGTVCGDTTTFIETQKGTAIMALSDGMGTGKVAYEESKPAMELLEQFMEAGFTIELAVKMINSALLLRSEEERFATLDICSVDLYSGKAEFMKIGAASAYILREGRVIAIRSQTLPVGIMQQISPDKNDMLLKDGDMILLMTDGITDIMGGAAADVAWLTEKFEDFHSNNPQDVADFILMEAEKTLTEGRRDDMTIMAARFWQRR